MILLHQNHLAIAIKSGTGILPMPRNEWKRTGKMPVPLNSLHRSRDQIANFARAMAHLARGERFDFGIDDLN